MAPTAEIDLATNLTQAGLVMIETASATTAPVPTEVPAIPLGRKPKPVVVVPDEPLQIVETRRE